MGGSDLILSKGVVPYAKVFGGLQPLSDQLVGPEMIQRIIESLLDPSEFSKFQTKRSLDFGTDLGEEGAVRFNFFHQQGSPALVGRLIAENPPEIDSLGIPPSFTPLLSQRNGLILVTGPTGSGKSTTLAAALDYLNQNFNHHIISIEDPIEYRHKNKRSVVEQIEIGRDALTFSDALRASLRQAPDVIMIGELRDRHSMEIAMTLAETGHLVLATVHARDAIQAISRMVDAFSPEQQTQICCALSQVLTGVLAQQLIPDMEEKQMVLASELLISCQAAQNLIRERKIDQIYSVLQSGGMNGMVTMNDSLFQLVRRGMIHVEDALARSARPAELTRLLNSKPQTNKGR
jgi:twitching motility protein PilT